MENVTKRIVVLQKGRKKCYKKEYPMLQKRASVVTKRILCVSYCNKICYKKAPEILHKGTLI